MSLLSSEATYARRRRIPPRRRSSVANDMRHCVVIGALFAAAVGGGDGSSFAAAGCTIALLLSAMTEGGSASVFAFTVGRPAARRSPIIERSAPMASAAPLCTRNLSEGGRASSSPRAQILLAQLQEDWDVLPVAVHEPSQPADQTNTSDKPLKVSSDPGDQPPEMSKSLQSSDSELAHLALASSTTTYPPSTSSEPPLSLWAARGLLLLVAAIWGTNFASVKYLEGLCFHPPCHHPPSEFALARFGVAALVSLPLLWRQPFPVVMAGLECGLTIALGYVTQAMALATIPSGECAFICSLTVVFVPLAAAALYGKPIRPVNFAAAAVALAGVGILEGLLDLPHLISGVTSADSAAAAAALVAPSDSLESTASAVTNPLPAFVSGPLETLAKTLGVESGDILALGQPIGFGYSFLRIEHYQEQYRDVPNRVLTIAAAQCVCVGVLSLLWVLHDYHGALPDFGYLAEPHRVATILWTGIVTTVAAIYLEGVALQTASATDASIAFSSEPVWASLFGFWLLHEQLGINSYVGGAVILSACLIGALADLKPKQLDSSAPSSDA